MMTYDVIIPEKPERQIKKLDRVIQTRVVRRLLELRENPELGKPLHCCTIVKYGVYELVNIGLNMK